MNEPFRMFPEAASRGAMYVDYVTWALLGITTLFSVGIAVAIVAFVAKYWHTRDVNRVSTSSHFMHWVIELTWSILPLILLLIMFAWGAAVYVNEHRPPKDCIDIYVVAKQWMWKISHQNGRREINSLHIPIGKPVRLTMISEDVIHSFYVPAFRVKRDVLPGQVFDIMVRAEQVGCLSFVLCRILRNRTFQDDRRSRRPASRRVCPVAGGRAYRFAGRTRSSPICLARLLAVPWPVQGPKRVLL